MKNLKEVTTDFYESINSFDAEDNNGEFKFKIGVEVTDMEQAAGESGFFIVVSAAKLPEYLTDDKYKDVADCNGVDKPDFYDVCTYGLCATMDSHRVETEEEIEKILNDIDDRVPASAMMCGFYFDKPMNAIGNTGWDFLNGEIGFK